MTPFSHSNRRRVGPRHRLLLVVTGVIVPQCIGVRQELYLYAVCRGYEEVVRYVTNVLIGSQCCRSLTFRWTRGWIPDFQAGMAAGEGGLRRPPSPTHSRLCQRVFTELDAL